MKVATLQTFVEAIRGVKVQPKESRRWPKAQNTKAEIKNCQSFMLTAGFYDVSCNAD